MGIQVAEVEVEVVGMKKRGVGGEGDIRCVPAVLGLFCLPLFSCFSGCSGTFQQLGHVCCWQHMATRYLKRSVVGTTSNR